MRMKWNWPATISERGEPNVELDQCGPAVKEREGSSAEESRGAG